MNPDLVHLTQEQRDQRLRDHPEIVDSYGPYTDWSRYVRAGRILGVSPNLIDDILKTAGWRQSPIPTPGEVG